VSILPGHKVKALKLKVAIHSARSFLMLSNTFVGQVTVTLFIITAYVLYVFLESYATYFVRNLQDM
jgi:hypothetical protein